MKDMSEEDKDILKYKQQRDMLIANTVKLLGFILLAIAFNRWWIALLVILFWTFLKED